MLTVWSRLSEYKNISVENKYGHQVRNLFLSLCRELYKVHTSGHHGRRLRGNLLSLSLGLSA